MTTKTPHIAAIGEVMVEISAINSNDAADNSYGLAFAGDTFNTAVGLARLGVAASYVTRLGQDSFSEKILALMESEQLSSDLVVRDDKRQPGLYAIANTPDGERSFTYWRGESAARQLWQQQTEAQALEQSLEGCDCIYLSGITLAIISAEARARLLEFLQAFHQRGGRVVVDTNYRPALWDSVDMARQTMGDFLAVADLALLTDEDEMTLWQLASPELVLEHHRQLTSADLILKRGPDPVLVNCHGAGVGGDVGIDAGVDEESVEQYSVPVVETVVDTTGAGDAFNAGFLSQWLQGADMATAVAMGNRVASIVIRHKGGVVPKDYFFRELQA